MEPCLYSGIFRKRVLGHVGFKDQGTHLRKERKILCCVQCGPFARLAAKDMLNSSHSLRILNIYLKFLSSLFGQCLRLNL